MHDHAPGSSRIEAPAGASSPDGHAGCGDVVARAERLCRDRDLQFTRLRREVLETIAGQTQPMGAYDIAERLSAKGRRVAAVSVYRALDFLGEHGLVHRIASRNAFVSCGHDHGEAAKLVFLICRTCGGIDETTAPSVENALDRTLARSGFRPSSRILEVEGECGACLAQDAGGGSEPGPAPPQ